MAPPDRMVQVLVLVLALIGLGVGLLCYAQATGFDDIRDQIQVMILALFAVGLVVLGTGMYVTKTITRFLRLWLLRHRSGSVRIPIYQLKPIEKLFLFVGLSCEVQSARATAGSSTRI